MTPSSHAPDLPTFIDNHKLPALIDQLREGQKNLKVAKKEDFPCTKEGQAEARNTSCLGHQGLQASMLSFTAAFW